MTTAPSRPFSFIAMMSELTGRPAQSGANFDPPTLTPLRTPIEDSKVGVLVSAGVFHTATQEPFAVTNDLSYRLIDRDLELGELTLGHQAAIRQFALRDLNVAYPIEPLRDLEASGVFKELARDAVSLLGAVSSQTELMQQTVPAMYDEFARQEVDVVLLLPFCPACHTNVPLIARAFEKRGLPTIMTSCLREFSEAYKAPRTAWLDMPMGCPAGKPNEPAMQREILTATLRAMPDFGDTWGIVDLPFQWSPDGSREWEAEVRQMYVDDSVAFAQRVASLSVKREQIVGNEAEFAIRCEC